MSERHSFGRVQFGKWDEEAFAGCDGFDSGGFCQHFEDDEVVALFVFHNFTASHAVLSFRGTGV